MPQKSSKMVVFSTKKLMIFGALQIISVCIQMTHTLNNSADVSKWWKNMAFLQLLIQTYVLISFGEGGRGFNKWGNNNPYQHCTISNNKRHAQHHTQILELQIKQMEVQWAVYLYASKNVPTFISCLKNHQTWWLSVPRN